jgi:hypothetical protein
MLPPIEVPDHKPVETGLLDRHGRAISRHLTQSASTDRETKMRRREAMRKTLAPIGSR